MRSGIQKLDFAEFQSGDFICPLESVILGAHLAIKWL